jgi:hypothetical protein
VTLRLMERESVGFAKELNPPYGQETGAVFGRAQWAQFTSFNFANKLIWRGASIVLFELVGLGISDFNASNPRPA